MVEFNFITSFPFKDAVDVSKWLTECILNENFEEGDLNFIFCEDGYLLEKNLKFLKHNTLTDVISFDYSVGKIISGDVFISIDRILENAKYFNVCFSDELHRVMVHGLLHFCGYKDKNDDEKIEMRSKEDYYLSLRNFV